MTSKRSNESIRESIQVAREKWILMRDTPIRYSCCFVFGRFVETQVWHNLWEKVDMLISDPNPENCLPGWRALEIVVEDVAQQLLSNTLRCNSSNLFDNAIQEYKRDTYARFYADNK